MTNLSFKDFLKKEKGTRQEKIRNVIDGQNLILFFKKGNKLFGTPEEGRIVFARMKAPNDDDEMPDGWEQDANFAALDLIQALNGSSTENLFSIKDMPEIKVLDKETMVKELLRCPNLEKPLNPLPSDDGIGFIKIKDRK